MGNAGRKRTLRGVDLGRLALPDAFFVLEGNADGLGRSAGKAAGFVLNGQLGRFGKLEAVGENS